MKTTLTRIAVAITVVGGMWALVTFTPNETSVTSEREVEEVVEDPVMEEVQVDVVDAAKAELERINTELDEEEARLLQEREEIDARLERIRETRMSFQ